jgi:hypothetical protein
MTDLTAGQVPRAPSISPYNLGIAVQSLRHPWVAMIMLSFIFIGGDVISFRVGGMTIRLVTFAILAAVMIDMLRSTTAFYYDRALVILSTFFIMAACISAQASYDVTRTIGYTVWLAFSFWIIVPLFANFARSRPLEETIRVWFWAYRLQVGLLFVEIVLRYLTGTLALTTLGRPHLWFYEPSYAAIYFSAYFGAALYLATSGKRRYGWDVLFSGLGCMALASTTAIFALGIAVLLVGLLSPYRWRLLGAVALAAPILGVAYYNFFGHTKYFTLVFGFLLRAEDPFDLILLILARAGNRVPRAIVSWYAFMDHPWTGIGFGADQPYTASTPGATLSQRYMAPWISYRGSPFINPYLEAAGTMGLAGLAALIALTTETIRRFWILFQSTENDAIMARAVFIGFFSMFLALQIEGTFLRFYVWSTLGLAFGAFAAMNKNLPAPVSSQR